MLDSVLEQAQAIGAFAGKVKTLLGLLAAHGATTLGSPCQRVGRKNHGSCPPESDGWPQKSVSGETCGSSGGSVAQGTNGVPTAWASSSSRRG